MMVSYQLGKDLAYFPVVVPDSLYIVTVRI